MGRGESYHVETRQEPLPHPVPGRFHQKSGPVRLDLQR